MSKVRMYILAAAVATAGIGLGGTFGASAVPIDAQKMFILNYCDQHPSLEYAKAVMELYHYKLPLKKTPPASSR